VALGRAGWWLGFGREDDVEADASWRSSGDRQADVGRGGVRVCQYWTVRGEGGEGRGVRRGCGRRGGQMGAGQRLPGNGVIGVEPS
jgi:hypothetical protein